MALTGQKAVYTSSVKHAAVTAWATGAAKTVGQMVRQTAPALNNERIFMCIVAGTTHATTEPTWNLGRGVKTTDNTVTWIEVTGLAPLNGDNVNTPDWNVVKGLGNDLGHVIKDIAGTHLFVVTTAGTSGAGAEPTWNVAAVGNTTVDNTVTWTYIGLQSAFTAWLTPHARFANALQTGWASNSGGTDPQKFYVGSDHAETQSAAGITWSSRGSLPAPIDVICANVAGSVPPVSADLATTASMTTTGSNSITINGIIRVCYGIQFLCGTSGNLSISFGGDSVVDKNFENCKFTFGAGVAAGAQYQFGNNMGRTTFRDCTWKFSNVGQGFRNSGPVRFINNTIDGAGSIPTQFVQAAANGSDFEFVGCDLSALSGSQLGGNNSGSATGRYGFYDCKMPASFTPWAYSGSNTCHGEQVTISRCSSAGLPLQYIYTERSGTTQSLTTVYRNGGAVENSTGFAWQIVTTANINNGNSFHEPPPIGAFNPTTGANVTVTAYGIVNAAALPKNDEIWLEVQYLGAAGHTQATIKSSKVADYLAAGSNHTADTSDWDDGVTARANTTAYVLGDVRKVASNPNRIFFCTTAGTSAGSEPVGYAGAVDGGSVTDGTAVFRAGVRFKMAVTLTSPQPALPGMLYGKVMLGKASTTYHVDPLLVLT